MFDYKELGLKAGIECHQQLSTRKLFCDCESELTEDLGDFEVKRKLRPVASETGQFDKAALQEFHKGKEIVYEAFNNRICLVELDEEPPHAINSDALKVVLEVALKTDSEIFDKAFVMRKLVIDGSNTSGFQRTVLIAQNGSLEINGKKVGVASVCLEEDAAKNLETAEHYTKYKLDRLGIPLIEFATKPDLRTPEEVKECAAKIGELFRITGKAKRGLGSIRQDVNVSIANGARIEIKGVQYLDLIDKYVENEVLRQVTLLEVKANLNKITSKEKQKFEIVDITDEILKSENKRAIESINTGQRALAITLNGFNGILGKEVQPNKRVGTELSSYAKAKAKVKGLFHSDELPKYGINENNVNEIKQKLKMQKEDAFVIVIEKNAVAEHALKAVFDRALELFEGIPEETRNPLEDGTTEYSRPLPGAERMYPETDVPPVEITKNILENIKLELPLWYDERTELFAKAGLNKQIAEQIAKSNYAKDFELRIKKYDIKALADFTNALPEKANVSELEWIINVIDRKDFRAAIDLAIKGLSKDEIIKTLAKSELDEISKKIILEIFELRKEFVQSKKELALNPLMGESAKQILAKTGNKPDMKQLADFILDELKKRI